MTLTEEKIDELRMTAFRTNDPADRQAYFDAVSAWFQHRDTRSLRAARSASIADTATHKLVPIEPTLEMQYAAIDTGCCTRPTDAYAAMLAAAPEVIADTAGAKPVAWRWRLTAEINGKQWGPGPWEYTIYPEKFESRSIYEIEPLYATPASSVADAAGALSAEEDINMDMLERAVKHAEHECSLDTHEWHCMKCGATGNDIAAPVVRSAEQDRIDAERYRWLRKQNWNEADMAVVCRPKEAIKLGYDCPNGERLDDAIDEAVCGKSLSKK